MVELVSRVVMVNGLKGFRGFIPISNLSPLRTTAAMKLQFPIHASRLPYPFYPP